MILILTFATFLIRLSSALLCVRSASKCGVEAPVASKTTTIQSAAGTSSAIRTIPHQCCDACNHDDDDLAGLVEKMKVGLVRAALHHIRSLRDASIQLSTMHSLNWYYHLDICT